jgi:UDP-N-acetylmuramate dehydrogenase
MLTIDHDIDLGPLTTFGCSAKAEYAASVASINDVAEAVAFAKSKGLAIRILGGGSNVLLTGNVEGLVIVNKLRQRAECIDGPSVHVRFGSGENWHDTVTWTVEQGWSGMENLALIPGTVGAAPMQNIGAYGVEQASIFEELEAFDIASGEIRKFTASDCAFGYRVSVFKRELRDQLMITSVTYRLSLEEQRVTSYRDVQEELGAMNVETPTTHDIYTAVVRVRTRKLPDPQVIGNAGSFFMNPVITAEQAQELQQQFPAMPVYPQFDGTVKVAAGWLIEQCGWKGARMGACGVHDRQALVLVNHGGANGVEILDLSANIQKSVLDTFNIALVREVNVW